MIERDRKRDLDELAKLFVRRLDRQPDGYYRVWGQDGKRPWGNSGTEQIAIDMLEILDIPCDEISINSRGEDCDEYSAEAFAYVHGLYDELQKHMTLRWVELLAVERKAHTLRTLISESLPLLEESFDGCRGGDCWQSYEYETMLKRFKAAAAEDLV